MTGIHGLAKVWKVGYFSKVYKTYHLTASFLFSIKYLLAVENW